jgi:hypothetical protein
MFRQQPYRGRLLIRQFGAGTVMPMAYSRQWLVEALRHLGFPQEADEALRVLPDEIDREQLLEFADRHGISSSELIDRAGGSP